MKRIIKAFLLIATSAMLVACAKENKVAVIERGTIDVSLDGIMGGYSSQDATKSEIQAVARLMWNEGDKVYVYDGKDYLGVLTASIENTDGTFAKLSGSITAPSGRSKITLVHSPLFSGQPNVSDGKISLDFSMQSRENVPFLVYSVLPEDVSVEDLSNNYVTKFTLATSIYKCNIAGLPEEDEVDEVRVYSVNTFCNLQLSDSEVPVVTGSNPGVITRKDGIMAADQRAIVTIALVESPAESRKIEVLKGDCYYDANFATSAIAPAKSYNAVFAVKKARLTVRFNLNGHGSTPIADQVLDKNAVEAGWIIKPSDPTASGYTFDGWYTESTCENAWDFNQAIDFSEPQPDVLTLYAKWEEGEIPAGALPCEFSVSNDNGVTIKKVLFSKGNLQATYDGTKYTWDFAKNQYDFIGRDAGNTTISNQTSGNVVDLFGWPTATSNYGICDSEDPEDQSDYEGDFVDWGTKIGDGNTWRTLTKDEWVYLFNTRTVNGGTGEGKSYSTEIIYGDKNGLVLYPDDYTDTPLSGTVENLPRGVVFLPAAGWRSGDFVQDPNVACFYSSSTAGVEYGESGYYCMNSYRNFVGQQFYPLFASMSVRLVTEAE